MFFPSTFIYPHWFITIMIVSPGLLIKTWVSKTFGLFDKAKSCTGTVLALPSDKLAVELTNRDFCGCLQHWDHFPISLSQCGKARWSEATSPCFDRQALIVHNQAYRHVQSAVKTTIPERNKQLRTKSWFFFIYICIYITQEGVNQEYNMGEHFSSCVSLYIQLSL